MHSQSEIYSVEIGKSPYLGKAVCKFFLYLFGLFRALQGFPALSGILLLPVLNIH